MELHGGGEVLGDDVGIKRGGVVGGHGLVHRRHQRSADHDRNEQNDELGEAEQDAAHGVFPLAFFFASTIPAPRP